MPRRLGIVAGLDVAPQALDAQLTDLFEARLAFAQDRLAGYAARRRMVQGLSRILRSAGAALLLTGAVLPALREAVPSLTQAALGGLAFGYVLLGLGAGALLIARGFRLEPSAGRLRMAEVAIEGERELFEADWRLAGEHPIPEARRRRLELARSFTAEINRIVRREAERAADAGGD
jgi:hypothetical protein